MQDFTNETIDLNTLPNFEHTTLQPPHPNYWKVIAMNIIVTFLVIGSGLATFLFLNEDARPYTVYVTGCYIIILVLVLTIYYMSFKKRGYALREKDILYKSGVIAEKTTVVPLNRIQHVALDEGLFSRMVKLATLQIHTAGGATGHLHISGIPAEQARAIKDALLKQIDAVEKTESN